MPRIYPFKPIVPTDKEAAKKVVCLPYDVFSYEEAKRVVEHHPFSILSVTRSDIFFDEKNAYEPYVYEKAKENLYALLEKNLLKKTEVNSFFVYRQVWQGRTQTGLVCLSDLEDYQKDDIKKHEKTRPEKERDRTTHIETLNAQTGNVFLAYRHNEKLHQILLKTTEKHDPMFELDYAQTGVLHQVWQITDDQDIERIQRIFLEIPCTYIADGHHRAASAFRLFEKENTYRQFLTTIFSDKELQILPYNRVVKNNYAHPTGYIKEMMSKSFELKKDASFSKGLGVFIENEWYAMKLRSSSVVSTDLEAQYLQDLVLEPIFGVKDPRKDKHIDFIGGIHGLKKLENLVNEGTFDVAFSLSSVRMEQLFEVADRNETMPPKSTWFEPKLLDGFFTYAY